MPNALLLSVKLFEKNSNFFNLFLGFFKIFLHSFLIQNFYDWGWGRPVPAALGAGASGVAATRALARFGGVARRFEFRGEVNGVTFVDDYAHLPSEVRAVLAAARNGGWNRVVAVFQPHRYSRTQELAGEFGQAFGDADVVVVTDVYGAGEAPVPGVSGQLVAQAIREARPATPVTYVAGRLKLRTTVGGLLQPGDLCCTLGAGDLTTLPDELMADPAW